jgi:thiol-disulfide isomerase/thioredoxin
MKYFPIVVFIFFTTKISGQTTLINGEIKGAEGLIQILSYDNPLSQQINLLAEVQIDTDGTFSYSFIPKKQAVLLFKVDGATTEILVRPGTELNFNFEVTQLPKTDQLGNSSKLVLIKASSSDAAENLLYSFEQDLKKLKDTNLKKNGKLSSKYPEELYSAWNTLLSSVDTDIRKRVVNSLVFSNSISYLNNFGSPKNYESLEGEFLENFEYTFEGLRSMKSLFVNDLLYEFFSKHLGKTNYFSFVDQSLEAIANEKLRSALELALITTSLDRKWANPDSAKQRLQHFIDENENPVLEQLALSIKGHYGGKILGDEIQNFTFTTLEDERFDLNNFRGKYLLIDFWATWCGPCVKSMKKLPQLKSEHENDLNILCISTSDNPDKVSKFINKNDYGKTLTFGLSTDNELIDSYFNISAIPLYFLVDPEGIIIDKAVNDPVEMVKKHLE